MKEPIPYEFGITKSLLKPFDSDEKKLKKLNRLLDLKEIDLIKKICKHYINHFIPLPAENENKYWIISCYPSTDNSPVRISIWFPEVFNIHVPGHYYNRSSQLNCMVFVHDEFLDRQMKATLLRKINGLEFHPEYRFVTGIREQLAAFMPLESYFSFVADENIYEAIRAHNYELTLKGKTPFKKGHNYNFVRYLLER